MAAVEGKGTGLVFEALRIGAVDIAPDCCDATRFMSGINRAAARSHDYLMAVGEPAHARAEPNGVLLFSLSTMIARPIAQTLVHSGRRVCLMLPPGPLHRAAAVSLAQSRSTSSKPNYDGHIPLNWFETGLLTAGSAFMAITNPRRGGKSLSALTKRHLIACRHGRCAWRNDRRPDYIVVARANARKSGRAQNPQGPSES